MSWPDFLIIFIGCALTMLICRVLPVFLLKGKELPENVQQALGFIPPAAFAALVANSLFTPSTFTADIIGACIPLIAAAIVVIVAVKTKSMLWCIVIGVAVYALLLAATSFL